MHILYNCEGQYRARVAWHVGPWFAKHEVSVTCVGLSSDLRAPDTC
jgi:hypothetical protein